MSRELSLLDTPELMVREWHVVYHPREAYRWWGKHLNPAFRHVDLMRPLYYGPGISDVMWLRVLPVYELLDIEVSLDSRPPWARFPEATVQKVTAARKLDSMRSWFDAGPQTCVEVVKMALGIRAFFVRTPFQLYKYIKQRNGVLISES